MPGAEGAGGVDLQVDRLRRPASAEVASAYLSVVVVAAAAQSSRRNVLGDVDVRAVRQQQRQPDEARRRRVRADLRAGVHVHRLPEVPDGPWVDQVELGVRATLHEPLVVLEERKIGSGQPGKGVDGRRSLSIRRVNDAFSVE